jgi:hypothetical protein
MKFSSPLALNYNSREAERFLREVIRGLPEDVELYLVGGAIRNALIREIHGITPTQRDYDQVVTKGSKIYTEYLASLGYDERPYPSHQDEQVVYSFPLNEDAKKGDSYINWLVLDLHTVDGTTIEDNLRNNAAFTINSCALNARDLYDKSLQDALIQALPMALQDIKDKQLRLNYDGYTYAASNFYAMLRFMSVGFAAPSAEEVQLLLKELPNLEHSRFDRNVTKVWNYVGGEEKARAMVRDLGIDIDVFDEHIVKSMIS